MPAPRLHQGRLQRALIIENPDPSLDPALRAAGIEPVRVTETPDRGGLIRLVQQHDPEIIFKRSRVEIDAAVLDAAPSLLGVLLCCIGDDSVDKQAAAERGVLVFNDPRSNGRSVAEMVLGELLVGARRLPDAWAENDRSHWSKSDRARYEVKGRTLGIYGLGNIGTQVARLAEGFGMDVLFHDEGEVAQAMGQTMDWPSAGTPQELFARSDIVTIHVSAEDRHGQSNRGLITRELLAALGQERPKDGPRIFLNLARGFLLEPQDLLAAVAEGAVRQAFVDVFPVEPNANEGPWENPYRGEPRIHCTPHIGASTRDAQPRIAAKMAQTARLWSHGGTVEDCVFAPKRRIDVAGTAEGRHILAVVHSDARGTKKAVDDAIWKAGINNLQSAHRDFPRFGIAYDLSVVDRALDEGEVARLVEEANALTGTQDAIRAVRQITL
jgi:D-3-phosphoglycerate dehydrogenase